MFSNDPTNPDAVIQDLARELSPQHTLPGGVITINAGPSVNNPFKKTLGNSAQQVRFSGPNMYINLLKFLQNYGQEKGNFQVLRAQVAYQNERETERARQHLRRIGLATEMYNNDYQQERDKKEKEKLNDPVYQKSIRATAKGLVTGLSAAEMSPFGVVTKIIEAYEKRDQTPNKQPINPLSSNPDKVSSFMTPWKNPLPMKPRPKGLEEKERKK